jgi:glycosyltransferase involved in cell wall biosynthesis
MYAGALLPALARLVPVLAVSPDPVDWDLPTVTPEAYEPEAGDLPVHFLGNNPDHLFAYRAALREPGVVVCHDVLLHHVLRGFAPEEEQADIAEQLGPEGAAAIRSRWDRGVVGDDEFLLPVVCRPIRRARAAIVHSRFARFAIQAEVPALPVFQVPMPVGAVPDDLDPVPVVRARLGLAPDELVVGLFGYLGPHKRVAESLRGVARARERVPGLRLVLAGAVFGLDVDALLASTGLTDVTSVTGPLDDRAFFEHMAAVDVVLSLRYPSMGESSAIASQAQRLGKPLIATDHAQFGEERTAVRVPPGAGEVERIADALVTLAGCQRCRSLLGQASRTRSRDRAAEVVANRFLEALAQVPR